MNKKGFTLVELIAVVAILAVTIIIVTVKIDNNIKDTNKFVNEQVINMIEESAYLYVENDSRDIQSLENKKVAIITIGTLINKGYLNEKELKNVKNSDKILIADINGNIKVKYVQTEKSVIFINGPSEISISVGKNYNELGAVVAIPGEGLINLTNSNINSNVNTNSVGEYNVTYSYTNAENVIRKVIVV